MTRIVLYLNQFFGQAGGEEAADVAPRIVTDVVGPGRALAPLLAQDEELAGTIVCGDTYFADHQERAAAECLALLRELRPDILLAGPAFNAGRYGVACGALCQLAAKELSIPAVTGMFEENPGAELYRKDVLIVRTGTNAATMRESLGGMLKLARKVNAGKPLGKPAAEGYIPQGKSRPELATTAIPLAAHIAARLPACREGSAQHTAALINLRNIRWTLAQRGPAPG